MIGYFPTPYPDELFYSICARYSDSMQYPGQQSASVTLFGTNRATVSVLLGRWLENFLRALPPGHPYTLDQIINQHTLFPFFAPFIPDDRRKRAWENMAYGRNSALPQSLGILSARLKPPSGLRFCPLCVGEDRERFGETYWHRLHQIPGIEICSVHHIWLESSQIPIVLNRGQTIFHSAERHIVDVAPRPFDLSASDRQALLDIVQDFIWLDRQEGLVIDLESLRQRYIAALTRRRLISFSGIVFYRQLTQTIKAHYSAGLLDLLQCNLDDDIEMHWVARLLKKRITIYHPLYYLLLANFLGFRFSEFLNEPTQYLPFGEGPWPCLNPICPDYHQESITEVVVEYPKRPVQAGPIGTFRCECGFTYSRKGPDRVPQDKFERNAAVEAYGQLWKDKLVELWLKSTLSLKQIAKQLGVSRRTLKRRAQELGLYALPTGVRVSASEGRADVDTEETREAFEDKLDAYRKDWKTIVEQNGDLKISNLKGRTRRIYRWLYRNDKEWLMRHLSPKQQRDRMGFPRVDWEKRDEELAEQVRETAADLKAQTTPVKRTSKTAIAKLLNKITPLHLYLHKLPRTAQSLAEVVETHEEFVIRRIWTVAEGYCAEGQIPSRTQFIRKAKLKSAISKPDIALVFEQALHLLNTADCETIRANLSDNIPAKITAN